MHGIELVAGGLTIVLALIGATFVPYFVLYVSRGRQRASCRAVVLVVVLGSVLGLGLGVVVQEAVMAVLAAPAIQTAVDAQCGPGVEAVTTGGFERHPYYSWLGVAVGCQYLDGSGWECYCATETP